MPAQYVKPYVKTNKNDYVDAEAIAEAVGRPTMRFVPIKNDAQLDLQSLHRVRERWVMRRTAVINQIRGLLLERGITVRKGRHYIEAALPGILEDADAKLSGTLRLLLSQLKAELEQTALRLEEAEALIEQTFVTGRNTMTSDVRIALSKRRRMKQRERAWLTKAAKHVSDEEDHQYRSQSYPRPASCAPAAIAVITATATK